MKSFDLYKHCLPITECSAGYYDNASAGNTVKAEVGDAQGCDTECIAPKEPNDGHTECGNNLYVKVQGLFVPFARVDPVILLGSYVCYTTNTLDMIEAFITETYVQLATTKPMCYSAS